VVLGWRDEPDLHRQLERLGWEPRTTWVVAHATVPGGGGFGGVSVIPPDPEAYARALYAELHRGDHSGVTGIVVEAVPEGPLWSGIADRLRRAAALG
jgi:L-threonylcarbamoyladenylate synthase